MFKKFCYYYLFKKKKGSCWHDIGVGVVSLILRHVSCRAKSAKVGHYYASKSIYWNANEICCLKWKNINPLWGFLIVIFNRLYLSNFIKIYQYIYC